MRTLGDTTLDTTGNLTACRLALLELTRTLRLALGETSLDLLATLGAVMKRTDAFLALKFDACAQVLSTLCKLATFEVICTTLEFTSLEAVTFECRCIHITHGLGDECTILTVSVTHTITRAAWRLTQTRWQTLQLLSTNNVTVVPITFTAYRPWIVEAYITLSVLTCLSAAHALEAWLTLSLATHTIACTTVNR